MLSSNDSLVPRISSIAETLTWRSIHAWALNRIWWSEDTGRFLRDQRVCEIEIWDMYQRRRLPFSLRGVSTFPAYPFKEPSGGDKDEQ